MTDERAGGNSLNILILVCRPLLILVGIDSPNVLNMV